LVIKERVAKVAMEVVTMAEEAEGGASA